MKSEPRQWQIRLVPIALATLATGVSVPAAAAPDPSIVVEGELLPDAANLPAGPTIKGVIAARNGARIKVAGEDGASTVIAITGATRIRSGISLGSRRSQPDASVLLNGLPVTVKTLQSPVGLVAAQISYKARDLKIARMIASGTAQQFEEQTAATEALRGRMGDIDKYNIKSTTNIFFDSGKYTLSAAAQTELCATAAKAEAMDNALLLVVGYTDSTGKPEANQLLSEKRATGVINFLQQACRWKPYRMLTPTGMASSDPLASNTTPEGKAMNRRVAVNILVSKALDGF